MNTLRAALLGFGLIALCCVIRTRAAGDSTAKTASPAEAARAATSYSIERFKAIVDSVKLTDDQKLKTGVLFDAVREQVKKVDGKTDAVAREKGKALFDKLRQDIAELLTDDQKLEVIKKMAPPGPAAIIDNIKAQLASPQAKLTDEQKKRAFAVLDDAKKRLEKIRTEALNGTGNTTARMNAVLEDMKVKLKKALVPTEEEKKAN